MKLYNGVLIVPGLVVFVIAITFPFWANVVLGRSADDRFQSMESAEGQQCVASREHMRANHMQMLYEWRDLVVREGVRTHHSENLGDIEISLTNTCMKCHAADTVTIEGENYESKATNCQDCHDYVGVDTFCWDCHIEPLTPPAKEAE